MVPASPKKAQCCRVTPCPKISIRINESPTWHCPGQWSLSLVTLLTKKFGTESFGSNLKHRVGRHRGFINDNDNNCNATHSIHTCQVWQHWWDPIFVALARRFKAPHFTWCFDCDSKAYMSSKDLEQSSEDEII